MWKRATGAIKDKNSLVVAYFSTRDSHMDLDFETAIIKATSHDEFGIDKRNAETVFSWIRASPSSLHPLVRALSKRMEKTRSWVVALKGLMLMHDLIHCTVPTVQKIGRLPFDLSSFSDRHSKLRKTWGFNVFIRQYFAFLDERAIIWIEEEHENVEGEGSLMVQRLMRLQKWQSLLDMLLTIRPRTENMKVLLILEAMDCVIIEIFDVYSRICSEIAKVLLEINSAGKIEATLALEILRKATRQGEELSRYFQFCKEYGVLKANDFHTATRILEEDVEELEKITNGVADTIHEEDNCKEKNQIEIVVTEENNTIQEPKVDFKTRLTDKWDVFYESININGSSNGNNSTVADEKSGAKSHPEIPLIPIDYVAVTVPSEIPDLIQL